MVFNALMTRAQLMRGLINPKRDINSECGYPEALSIEDYRLLYEREGIAARCVNVMPEESWALDPEIVEGEQSADSQFEKDWKALDERHNLLSYLLRADELSGVGSFGVLLLGIDDGRELHEPVEGVSDVSDFEPISGGRKQQRKLLYIRAFSEVVTKIDQWENDTKSPRFGQPRMYSIKFMDISTISSASTSFSQQEKKVHWSRVIHLADNRRDNEVFGTPRMQIVFNRLYDLRKLVGGSAEMFWSGAFPGLSLEADPRNPDIEFDLPATKTQMEAYQNGLQRYLALTGVQAKSLAPQVADPSDHFEMQCKSIAIAMKVPYRVFLGTEEARLAGSQDTRAFNRRLGHRQVRYLNPWVVRPTVNRLIAMAILPPVKRWSVNWPDLNTLSDTEKAEIMTKRTEALAKYVAGGVDTLVPPLEFFTQFLELESDEAEAIIEAAEEWIEEHGGGEEEDIPPEGAPTARNPAPTERNPREGAGSSPRTARGSRPRNEDPTGFWDEPV